MVVPDGEPKRCKARSRQSGERCLRWSSPFQELCPIHGANTVRAREAARKRMNEYILYSPDPAWLKNRRLQKWKDSNDRWEMRRARKAGPQAVAQLLAHRAAEKAEKHQIAEDNARARAEKRAAWKRERAARNGQQYPASDEPQTGYGVAYEGSPDWDL